MSTGEASKDKGSPITSYIYNASVFRGYSSPQPLTQSFPKQDGLCIVLLPFTMVGIFMEMINAKRLVQCGMRLEVAIFLSVWFSSVLISIPAMGTYKFEDTVNPSTLSHCSRVFILDSQLLTNLYEGLFVCSISVLPTFFMLGALHRLKFRMHLLLLCQPIPHGLHKKVRKIRWIFFYTVFFIVFWLAPGPAIYIVRLTDKRGESQVPGQRQTPRDFPLVLRCGFLLQVAMQPLFFLYAQQQFNLWEWFQRCPIVKCLCSRAVGRMRRRRKTLRGMEISSIMHMETYAVSSQGQLNNLYY
ncbi:hypothetical protein Fcan01_06775 [Folsomia candida]|uniref:Uncharacterized protein n=1 Tax=Folsomia candida TaxID=158441 RepID=A0A226ELA4_FOLCA|nr:hypothetical protein Fcan01_06775 [Folsomia candida]